jgi:type IV pilus assembly protein PilC
MLFRYQVSTPAGEKQQGEIEAPNVDLAIASLQRRGLVILDIQSAESRLGKLSHYFTFNTKVKLKEIVFLSRQISTLFEAKVSALAAFQLLAGEAESPVLRNALTAVVDDLNAGLFISAALAKHPRIFSDFYVNMVKAGEESGKLAETFNFLSGYMERSYALVSKAKNALIYPAFIICSFVVVMILMLVYVIPKLSAILLETGQEIPIYTKVVLWISAFFVNYGIFFLILVALITYFLIRYLRTQSGNASLSSFKLSVPYVGDLYKRLYLSRIADNLSTMVTSGISMVRALEITASVVDNVVYKAILDKAAEAVKSGKQISAVFYEYPEIPTIMVQMIRVGEETGKLGFILDTLSRFYQREVFAAVDTLVDLIEPAMIVLLGLGVGILLTSVLVPIYNVASGI